MAFIHPDLAAGGWKKFTLFEQLGNVGSDVDRALQWKEKGNEKYWKSAVDRALELMDFTLQDSRWKPQLKELCRARDCIADYFFGGNQYGSSPKSLSSYFYHFALAARANR